MMYITPNISKEAETCGREDLPQSTAAFHRPISAMGATVFFKVADWPVGLLFVGLFAIYFSDLFASIGL
ncbi:hypothetical protein GCM10010388_66140 [Streptomyces mauvecolor]